MDWITPIFTYWLNFESGTSIIYHKTGLFVAYNQGGRQKV